MNCAGGKALFTTADSTNGGLTEGLDETTMEVGEDGTKNEKEEGERQMLGEGEMSRGKGKGNGKGFNKRIQGNHVSTPNPTPTPTPNTLSTQINLPPHLTGPLWFLMTKIICPHQVLVLLVHPYLLIGFLIVVP